ncbi:MAG: GspH/FimT family pseudopilin [Pseudomonadota bacterium]|nr:GspH/FimT family pseudopilin [Pseudomonadota bacterium]
MAGTQAGQQRHAFVGVRGGAAPRPRQPNQGLTLIEILATLTILSALLTLAIPSFARLIADWQVSSAVNRFHGHLRWARQESMRQSTPVSMCSGNADGCRTARLALDWSSGWIVFTDRNGNGQLDLEDELLAQESAPAGLQAVTASTTQTLTFRPNGLLSRGRMSRFAWTSSLRHKGKPHAQRLVCINATGRARTLKDTEKCA